MNYCKSYVDMDPAFSYPWYALLAIAVIWIWVLKAKFFGINYFFEWRKPFRTIAYLKRDLNFYRENWDGIKIPLFLLLAFILFAAFSEGICNKEITERKQKLFKERQNHEKLDRDQIIF